MKTRKSSIVFYKSYNDAIRKLPDAESRDRVYNAIFNFAFTGTEPDMNQFNVTEGIIVEMALPTVEASIQNYLNGCKGGRPKKDENQRLKPVVKSNVNVNLNSNDNSNDNYNENSNENKNVVCKTTTTFLPPSIQEIRSYCKEKNLKISPEYFFNYYDQKNWENVLDWKLCALGWDKNEKKKTASDSNDPYAAIRR